MKLLFSTLGLLCLLFITVQCQPKVSNEVSTSKSLTDGKYVKGKIMVKATSKNKTGIIRAFIDESQTPKKLRGLVYQREGTTFGLHEIVYFQVEEKSGIVMATNVTKSDMSGEMYSGSVDYDMNLHTGHVEDGAHTKVHIVKPPTGGNFTVGPTIGGVSLTKITYFKLPTPSSPTQGPNQEAYVKTSALNNLDLNLDYYMSQITVLGGNKVYEMSLTHDHQYD